MRLWALKNDFLFINCPPQPLGTNCKSVKYPPWPLDIDCKRVKHLPQPLVTNWKRFNYPPQPLDIDCKRKISLEVTITLFALKDRKHTDWAGLVSVGQGVQSFRADPVGNYWLFNQQALRAGQFIEALQMRTNTCETRMAIHRAVRDTVTIYRRCQAKPETLGHVLGECMVGKRLRIERHNWVVGRREEEANQRGNVKAREQEFNIEAGSCHQNMGPGLHLLMSLFLMQ